MTTIGAWNIENFLEPGGPFGPSDRATVDRKVSLLAETIRSADVDVLSVEEVGDPTAFEELRARLGDGWSGVLSTHFEVDHPIRVGFLSRLPIEESCEFFDIPPLLQAAPTGDDGAPLATMGRGALRIRVRLGADPLDLVAAHLKSKLLSFPGRTPTTTSFVPKDEAQRARYGAYALNRRAAEAAAVRGYADDLLAGDGSTRLVAVMGDLNDEVRAATTQILQGPPGSEIGSAGENHPDRGDAWRLLNLAPLIPEERRFSRIFEGRKELIDHILVSTALRHRITSADTVTGATQLPSITVDAAARKDSPVSDHAMVVATIKG
ncbi:endonuclease/exonuclease/phosphatase family protein [Glaciibacter flavus]|uniref:endonuclease/exonuclease/phosphatase family protein n=1 Tax=Orlajensenia flava TaxID=2565934 RepID=UPI003B00DA63